VAAKKTDEVLMELRQRIVYGKYPTDQRLPPERELAKELRVNRDTVRAALFELQGEGLVRIIPRSGVYVGGSHASKITIGGLISAAGYPYFMFKRKELFFSPISKEEARGHLLEEQDLEETHLYLFDEISEEIKAKIEDPTNFNKKIYRVHKLHSFDREPVAISDTYISVPQASFLPVKGHQLATNEERQGFLALSQALEDAPKEGFTQAIEQIQTRFPTPDEGKLLNISKISPVIELERWAYKSRGSFSNYARWVLLGTRFQFVYHIEQ
jgi:DNA-binding GntR family transcriptional regulator